jgi:2-methylcitrate dehydratase PrpD
VLRHARPENGLERKFSMQFCAAAALATGRVDLGSFADGPGVDPGTRALMDRVRMLVDPTLPDGLNEHAWTRVTVRLRDGRALASPPRGASGHPDQPLTDAQLLDKFLQCAAPVIGAGEAEDVAAQLAHLEDIPDVRALTARLVTPRD